MRIAFPLDRVRGARGLPRHGGWGGDRDDDWRATRRAMGNSTCEIIFGEQSPAAGKADEPDGHNSAPGRPAFLTVKDRKHLSDGSPQASVAMGIGGGTASPPFTPQVSVD